MSSIRTLLDVALGSALIGFGALCYWVLLKRTDDALHPLGTFTLLWLGVFGFAHFNVPRTFDEPYYADPFGLLTYAVAFGGLIAFAVGFWLVDPGATRMNRRLIAWRFDAGVSWPRLRLVTLGLFGVATLMTAYFVQQAGEIPLFSPRIDELRRTFKLPFLGYIYDLHWAVVLFGAMIAQRSERTSQRLLWVGIVAASVFQLSFGGVRVSPMTALAWIFIYLFYRSAKVRFRHMVVAVALGAVTFGVIEGYRRTMYVLNPSLVNPRLDLSPAATLWAHSAASFKNLQFTLERGASPLNMGLNSYDLPKTLNPAARVVDDQLSYMYGTHNTPTFMSILYFDFGVGGLLVMPLLYGAMTAFVYKRFRFRGNIFWLVLYIDFLLASMLAFRTHRFLGNSLIWFGAVAMMVQLFAGRSLEGLEPPEDDENDLDGEDTAAEDEPRAAPADRVALGT